jgi:hypothetical protein
MVDKLYMQADGLIDLGSVDWFLWTGTSMEMGSVENPLVALYLPNPPATSSHTGCVVLHKLQSQQLHQHLRQDLWEKLSLYSSYKDPGSVQAPNRHATNLYLYRLYHHGLAT